MSRYSKVFSYMWRDEVFNTLSDRGKLLFVYALTSPHSNILGLYLLAKSYIAFDMCWSVEEVENIIQELQELDLIRYDENEVIYIPKFLKHNKISNMNQMIPALNTFLDLPKSSFHEDLLDKLKTSVDNAIDSQREKMDSAYKKFISDLEAASKRLVGGCEAASEKEERRKKKEERRKSTPDPQKVAEYNSVIEEKFENFWKAYPKKRDKKKARSRFASLFPLDMDKEKRQKRLQHMGLHLNQYMEEKSDTDEKYIKYPATWLNSVDFDFPPDPEPDQQPQWSEAS